MIKNIEIFFRRLFLNLFLLFYGQKKKSIPQLRNNSKILFIRLNRIGDALVTTPLFKIFKDSCNCKIDVLADIKNHFVFSNNPHIDNIIVFKKGLNGFKESLNLINNNSYDIVVDLHDDVSTTVTFLIGMIKADSKISLKKENNKVYNCIIPKLDPATNHVVDRLLNIPKYLNIEFKKENVNIAYYPPQESFENAAKYLSLNELARKYLVGINISAGNDARFWGVERFKELIKSVNQYDVNILILTAEKDLSKAQQIADNKYPIYYSERFDHFSAMISKLDFLFTPDTSIVHIASCFKIPMYGLYVKYKTDNLIWYPYASDYESFVTLDANFENVSFEKIETDFIKYFEKNYYEKPNTRL